jgi:hypothetical protein
VACYLICAGTATPSETSRVKIGYAVDVADRIAGLQTGHWDKLHLIRTWPAGSRKTEAKLQRMFRHVHIGREWFTFDPAMMTAEVLPDQIKEPYHLRFGMSKADRYCIDFVERAEAIDLVLTKFFADLNINYTVFTRWKNGTTSPRLETVIRIQDALAEAEKAASVQAAA